MTAQTDQRPTDVNDFLMGNGDGPSAPFLKMGPAYFDRPQHTAPGEWKGGRIVAMHPVQAYKLGPKDPQTGKPTRILQTHQSGKKAGQPIWDALVILQTTEHDPTIEGGDDGLRQIQLDGFDRYWEATADADCRKRAARLAVTAAGARGLEVGGELYLAWMKQVPTGSMPATHWVAKYVPPGQSFQFDGQQPPAPAPAVAQVAQQYAQQVQQGYAQGPSPSAPQYPAHPAPATDPWATGPRAAQQAPQQQQPAQQGYVQPPVQPAPQGHTPQGASLPAEPPF